MKRVQLDQLQLVPVDMLDWLPEDDLAEGLSGIPCQGRFVLDLIGPTLSHRPLTNFSIRAGLADPSLPNAG